MSPPGSIAHHLVTRTHAAKQAKEKLGQAWRELKELVYSAVSDPTERIQVMRTILGGIMLGADGFSADMNNRLDAEQNQLRIPQVGDQVHLFAQDGKVFGMDAPEGILHGRACEMRGAVLSVVLPGGKVITGTPASFTKCDCPATPKTPRDRKLHYGDRVHVRSVCSDEPMHATVDMHMFGDTISVKLEATGASSLRQCEDVTPCDCPPTGE